MPGSYLDEPARAAFRDAIVRCEERSAAEIVVAVRAQAHTYVHVPLVLGIAAALATIGFLLYSPWPFPLWAFLVDPLLAGLVLGGGLGQFAAIRRLCTPPATRARWVERDALATFAERRIADTRGRTGVLVYLGLTERRAVVIADRGVREVAPTDGWAEAVAAIERVAAAGGDGPAVAGAIERLGDCLAPVLPRTADDVNELPDELAT